MGSEIGERLEVLHTELTVWHNEGERTGNRQGVGDESEQAKTQRWYDHVFSRHAQVAAEIDRIEKAGEAAAGRPLRARKRQMELESTLTDDQALAAFLPLADGDPVTDLTISERRRSHIKGFDVFIFSWKAP
jgi:hypothetical protein